MVGTYHGNKIDQLGKMIWPQSIEQWTPLLDRL